MFNLIIQYPMNKFWRYVIAVLACIVIFVLYVVICIAAEFNSGGGVIILGLVCASMVGVWKLITSYETGNETGNEQDETLSDKQNTENN